MLQRLPALAATSRCRWRIVFLSLTVCLLAVTATGGTDARSRPNIVFLLSDDQTVGAVGCYGNREIHTPHLDQLARDGVRFTNHYNTTSICMASRCSVLTGLYEYRHGCNFQHGDLQRRFMDGSYPLLLRQAGYFTGFAGKIGFELEGEPFEALAPLFDRWAGGPGQTHYATANNPGIAKYSGRYPHCTRAYAAWAVDFLADAQRSGKPFCLSISFKAPHLPFTPDASDRQRYQGKTFSRPANFGVDRAKHLSPQSQTSRAATAYRQWVDDFDNTTASYYALITGVDAALGLIRQGLADAGLADNTVIIFTSDNGYHCGAHGFGDKVLPYEEGSKSPLIIYDPRLAPEHAGTTCNAVTANADMAATILALAGVPAAGDIDGRNLVPLLTNPHEPVRHFLPLFNFWGIPSAQSMAVVTQDWKYIHWYYAGERMLPTDELFHLAQDRLEMHNLAGDLEHAEQLNQLRQFYDLQLRHIESHSVSGHGYKRYSTLFSRTISWDLKAPLLKSVD